MSPKIIPNALTLIRLALAFVFPFIAGIYRFPIIVISLLTEFFDGVLARKFNWGSKFGALMDPIADHTFVFSVAFTMFFESQLTWWQFLLIGTRDAVVFFGALTLIFQHNYKAFLHVRPRWSGKIATAFQFALICWFFYFSKLPNWLLYLTWFSSAVAGGDYLYLLIKRNFYSEYNE